MCVLRCRETGCAGVWVWCVDVWMYGYVRVGETWCVGVGVCGCGVWMYGYVRVGVGV